MKETIITTSEALRAALLMSTVELLVVLVLLVIFCVAIWKMFEMIDRITNVMTDEQFKAFEDGKKRRGSDE